MPNPFPPGTASGGGVWITDWSDLKTDALYICCAINSSNGRTYLSRPAFQRGWQIRQSNREGCYAALESPDFPADFYSRAVGQ